MKSFKVRGKQIGDEAVTICAPLCAQKRFDLLSEARRIVSSCAPMVEWRLDLCQEAWTEETLQLTMTALREVLGERILLVTIRTAKEGGAFAAGSVRYQQLYRWVLASGQADLIDVEASQGESLVASLIREAHERQVGVIVSSHDFAGTPSEAEMLARLRQMQEAGGDLIKLAVMPRDATDVLALLSVTTLMHKEAKVPLITMSMGALGAISRLSGEVFGSAVTFASAAGSSAPGQLSIDLVAQTLSLLHEALAQEKREKSL